MRKLKAISIGLLALFILGIGQGVGAETSIDTLTGCLTKGGTLTKVAVGAVPMVECSSAERQVTWGDSTLPEIYTLAEVWRMSASDPAIGGIAECDPGDIALSGGWSTWIEGAEIYMDEPWRLVGQPPTAWMVGVRNPLSSEGVVIGFVTCIDTNSVASGQ